MRLDSIEVDESMYPIVVKSRKIAPNSLGHGQWDGSPALEGEYGPLNNPMVAYWGSDGDINPPLGVLGGGSSAPSLNWKRKKDESIEVLKPFGSDTFEPGEFVGFRTCGGGGYGSPINRDPTKVVDAVLSRPPRSVILLKAFWMF